MSMWRCGSRMGQPGGSELWWKPWAGAAAQRAPQEDGPCLQLSCMAQLPWAADISFINTFSLCGKGENIR